MTQVIKRKYNVVSTKNAQTLYCDDGSEVLQSYDTQIVRRYPDGTIVRLWSGWTPATGRHIRKFCNLNKEQYVALPIGNKPEDD